MILFNLIVHILAGSVLASAGQQVSVFEIRYRARISRILIDIDDTRLGHMRLT